MYPSTPGGPVAFTFSYTGTLIYDTPQAPFCPAAGPGAFSKVTALIDNAPAWVSKFNPGTELNLEADIRFSAPNTRAGVVFRVNDVLGSTYYRFWMRAGTNAMALENVQGGAVSQTFGALATFPGNFLADDATSYFVEVRVLGQPGSATAQLICERTCARAPSEVTQPRPLPPRSRVASPAPSRRQSCRSTACATTA